MSKSTLYIKSLEGPILVAGASGFVGANLFKRLAEHREDVFAVVQADAGWRLDGVNYEHTIAVDFNDRNATQNLIDTVKPKTVFDCVAYGAYSFEKKTDLIYQTNFLSVVHLIEGLAKHGIAAYVHAGSSSEYGANCSQPKEDDQCIPNSHYAVS